MGTATTSGVNAGKGGVKVTPASNSGAKAAAGTTRALTKVHNPPGPRQAGQ
jgi:hypothetical protein